MLRALVLVVLLASIGFLLYLRLQPPRAPAPPPPATPVSSPPPTHVFDEADISRIRLSLQDADPSVRWATVQLLSSAHDPELGARIEKMLASDSDVDLRVKIVGMMKSRPDLARLGGLVSGLRDPEAKVRLAALSAVGDVGDPSILAWVTALLKDADPAVRAEALRTMGRFQDKRKAEFQTLSDKLKKDYEEDQRRAKARR